MAPVFYEAGLGSAPSNTMARSTQAILLSLFYNVHHTHQLLRIIVGDLTEVLSIRLQHQTGDGGHSIIGVKPTACVGFTSH